MERDHANQILEDINLYKFTSLSYTEPDEILDYSIIDRADAIILTPDDKGQTKIHWASNHAKDIVSHVNPLNGPLYIEFIPEEFVNELIDAGFTIHSEFLDFFNNDLCQFTSEAIDPDDIVFMCLEECEEASKVTQACKNDSRGFHGETKEWFEEWIGSEHNKVLTLKIKDAIIGLCCVSIYDFENEKGPTAWIREIAVKPEYRGQGFAKRLLEQAIKYTVSKGAKRGFLHCDIENKNAIGLYNKYGFHSKPGRGQINMIRSGL